MRLTYSAISGMPVFFYDINRKTFIKEFRNFFANCPKTLIIKIGNNNVDLTNEFKLLAGIVQNDFNSVEANFENALSQAKFFVAINAPNYESKLLILFWDLEVVFDIKENKFYNVLINHQSIVRSAAKEVEPPIFYSQYLYKNTHI